MTSARLKPNSKDTEIMIVTLCMTDDRNPMIEANVVMIEGCRVAVHRDPLRARHWAVTEPQTGRSVSHGATRREAIQKAREKILRYGVELFRETVENLIQ